MGVIPTRMMPMGAWRKAKRMRCAVFDGASCARRSVGNWTTAAQGSLSMACWLWIVALPSAGPASAMSLQISTAASGAQLDPIVSATRKFRCLFQNVAVLGPTANEVGGIGEWHHYAFSYNYANASFAGFVDGAKLITATPNRWLNAGGELFATLAANGTGAGNFVNGKIANANIYLRALSDAEVAALAAGVGVVPSDADHQWLFANDDFTDTGTAATKWNLEAQSSTGSGSGNITFEDV